MTLRIVLALMWLMAVCPPLSAQTTPSSFEIAARSSGTPDIPGLNMVWLTPWGRLALAREWRNIVVHQSEGAPGSAFRSAVAQMQRPNRRGTTIWVETDGTVYWAVAEFAVPNHLRDGNRNDNKYIDNSSTYQQVDNDSSIGVEFVGNYPNVRRPVTEAQAAAWRILVRVLQTRCRRRRLRFHRGHERTAHALWQVEFAARLLVEIGHAHAVERARVVVFLVGSNPAIATIAARQGFSAAVLRDVDVDFEGL
eukprot:gene3795-5189_t